VLGVIAVTVVDPVTYAVFPALIWAAFRFGPPGAALAVAITAALAIGITAADVGPFSKQAIDHRTIGTQLYIAVAALTTLILAAVVAERARSAAALTAAKLREGEHAVEERRRIARDLHDTVSQTLFSTVLHTRTAQQALIREGDGPSGRVGESLAAIADLTRSVQSEMRALISELHPDVPRDGLVDALARHASGIRTVDGLTIDVRGPERLILPELVEAQLYAIGREALANVERHAGASEASVLVEAHRGQIVLEVRDNGRGFDPAAEHPGHFGLDSMRTRARDIGGRIAITSAPEGGTLVRVSVAADTDQR